MGTTAAQKINSAYRHLRTDSAGTFAGLALTRLHGFVFGACAFAIKAWWARRLCMRLGRRARIHWSAAITGHARIAAGDDLFVGLNCHLKSLEDCRRASVPNLQIGNRVFINDGTIIDANYLISIGDDTMFGPFCLLIDSNHDFSDCGRPIRDQSSSYDAVSIGTGCWIGAHVVILPGVNIGRHTVIAANSTVTRDIPPFCVAAGSPAQVIRRIASDEHAAST
jgi:acetyltransferase-like isoleucine patch superfamily enzyme